MTENPRGHAPYERGDFEPFGPAPDPHGDGGAGTPTGGYPWPSAAEGFAPLDPLAKGDSLRDDTTPSGHAAYGMGSAPWSEDERPADDLATAAPPSATRLNRLAVVIAAVVMSATLLIIAFAVGGAGENEAAEAEREANARRVRHGQGDTFLDRPVGPDSLRGAVDPITGLSEEELARGDLSTDELNLLLGSQAEAGGGELPVPPPYGTSGSYASSAGAYDPAPTYSAPPPSYEPAPARASSGGSGGGGRASGAVAEASPRVQALARAQRSSLAPQGVGGLTGGGGAADPTPQPPAEGAAAYLQAFQAAAAGASPAAPPLLTPRFGLPDGSDMAADPADERSTAAYPAARPSGPAGGRYVAGVVERPASPYEVREGTVVEATLITGIHSDLPGEVVAQVSRNVYDSQTQQVLLIPRGARLVGTYDNAVALDQGRLLVAWTRLVFPDGRSLALPGLNSTDPSGASGLPGRVNRHFFRAFGNAVMLAVVGGGLSLGASRTREGGGTFGYPSPAEVMAGSVATELARVATEMLRGNVNRRPTIRVPAGTRFAVFVSSDLALAPYASADGFMRGGAPVRRR